MKNNTDKGYADIANPNQLIDKKEYFEYFDVLRVIAAFSVVILHICATAKGKNDLQVGTSNWYVNNVYNNTFSWGVDIFTMISGALFLRKDIAISDIYKKYIPRILTAFFFWSFVYALVVWRDTSVMSVIKDTIMTKSHMWYCLMIVGLYAMTPLLRQIARDGIMLKYFLILSGIFTIVIPQLLYVLGLSDFETVNAIGEIIQTDYDYTYLGKFFGGYIFFYMLGYYLSIVDIPKNKQMAIYVLGIMSLLLGIAGCIFASQKLDSQDNTLFSNGAVAMVIFVTALFIYAKYNFKSNRLIKYLSSLTFGIYLIHMGIIRILNDYIDLAVYRFNPVFYIPLVAVGVFIAAALITYIIKLIPVLKKYIV